MNLPIPMTAAGAIQPQRSAVVPLSVGISQEQKVELLEYWRSIVKRKWAIAGLALGVALLAGAISYALTPVYEGTATVLIEDGKVKILSIDDVYTNSQQREHYQTQVEIIKSREVAERTVRALKLWEKPLFDPRRSAPGLRDRALAALGIGSGLKKSWTEEELVSACVHRLMDATTVSPVRLSELAKVQVQSEDRTLAADLANALAREYIDADRDERMQLSQQVSQQLQDRLADLRGKLSQSEKALQDYREKKGILNLAGSAQTTAGQQVGGMTEKLMIARNQRIASESAYLAAKAAKSESDYGSLPEVIKDPLVVDTQKSVTASKVRLADLLQTLGPNNERVIQAQGELADLTATLHRQQAAVVASLTRQYQTDVKSEQALEQALGSARSSVRDVNREEFELGVLEREYQSNRQLYEMFMSRAKETNSTGDVQSSVARIADRAVPPDSPIKPRKVQIVLVSAILAAFIGAMASLLLDRLDNTVKGGDDAESRLKQPVLAALPEVQTIRDRARMARLFVEEAHSQFAEGIRTARTGVLLSNLDVSNKIILVTSTLPGEGKTTVAANLALAHAQTKPTLLIDCDMRRAQVAKSLGVAAGSKGLTNFVAGNAELRDCLSAVKDSPLLVMPVGDMPPNPLELLLSKRFKDALAELSTQFEMVIIDSPPVELVSEALVLAPMATSIAFVVKAMSTPAPLVRKSLARLQRAQGNILGILVNHLDFKLAQRYYGEYGGSSYNYGGYGYGPELTNDAATDEASAVKDVTA